VSIANGSNYNMQLMSLEARVAKLEQRLEPCSGRVNHTEFRPLLGDVRFGIHIHVDTSHCNFTSTPVYLTSLTGTNSHWLTVGISAIYWPTRVGFDVYLSSFSPSITSSEMHIKWAALYDWALEWVGIQNTAS